MTCFKAIIEQFEQFHSAKLFFLQRGEIAGYRHTQIAEIHLGTLLVVGETLHSSTVKERERVVSRQGPVHQHNLYDKGREGIGIPRHTSGQARPSTISSSKGREGSLAYSAIPGQARPWQPYPVGHQLAHQRAQTSSRKPPANKIENQ